MSNAKKMKAEETKAKKVKKTKAAKIESRKRRSQLFKKYRALMVSIIAFLSLYVAVLGLNYFQSFQISRSAHELAVAGRQGDLIQQITKNLIDINLIAERMEAKKGKLDIKELKSSVFKQYDQLVAATKVFDSSLNAFADGGNTLDASGHKVSIKKTNIAKAQHHIETAIKIWKPFKGLIANFSQGYRQNNLELETINFASDYARIYNKELLGDMNDLSAELQAEAEKHSANVKIVQIVGIAVALLIFMFIVFRVIGSLLRSDRELELARQETTDILDTVQEGLFLISPDYVVGDQHSKELDHILPIKNIAGKPFDELISPFVNEKDLLNTKRFINQLFNKNVKENLIKDLNPLNCLALTIEQENAIFSERYLRFSFSRVYENKKIIKVLVSITDITNAVLLQQQLEEEREQNALFTGMLMKVLMVEPELLNSFIRNTDYITDKINNILRKDGKTQTHLKEKVNAIFREVHSLKGESSALELDSFVSLAEDTEDKLKAMRDKSKLSGNDFIPIAVSLASIIELNQNLKDIQEKLANFSNEVQSAESSANEAHIKDNTSGHNAAGRKHAEEEKNKPVKNADSQAMQNLLEKTIKEVEETETNEVVDASDEPKADNLQTDKAKQAIAKQIKVFSEKIADRNGKQVDLHVEGFVDNELSMPTMDIVKEISIQFIRNAIVHGIEKSDVRMKSGKSERGNIHLQLLPKEGHYELMVEDDGNGIDLEALRDKLRTHPHYKNADVDKFGKKELYSSMFLSGVSTASASTEDAGRGEGMGIIYDRIKSLKGRVQISSTPGKMTRFVIQFTGTNRN